MDTNLIHADIFFFVSTVLLSLLSIGILIIVIYAIKIARDARSLVSLVKREAEKISADIEDVRQKVKEKESSFTGVIGLVSQLWKMKKKGRKKI